MADSGDRANKTVPSRDEGSSDGSSDSEAQTDESGASRNKDLNEIFKSLTISTHGEETPGETPQQKRYRSVESTKKAKQKLNFDAAQSHDDGKWIQDHPWEPSPAELINKTVDKSKVYTVSDKWLTSSKKQLDLEKIYLGLPTFIDEMKGPSIRKELEDILNSEQQQNIDTKPSPHVLEIKQKDDPPKDKPSRPKGTNNNLKAFSLPPPQDLHAPSEDNYWFLDCEYMLTMYLPDCSSQWFNCGDQQGKRIRKINSDCIDKRWIFIPSFCRAKIALLEWPQDDIVTQASTVRILVVRPSEFEEYVKYCGHLFPVISLPQDEIGAGYPRYWIQKIALFLKLQFIWMIDDSVECFYEYHPALKPEVSYPVNRRRKFGLVFKRIEGLVKATKDEDQPIAAMSPKRFMGGTRLNKPFVCKPPRIAVFLNVDALKLKEVYYRPELQVLEDMIFGYECAKNGLKVFIDNRVHLQDHDWKDTGARSASVKQKQT
ncbi:uncharacterized protein [Montipora capricornis]|uniref:uncharacterized protein n=1 Tax=Montipora capricornis TaxID=246305 RepID=UPI0035F18B24